ncbi:hypothetical protein GUITHDRAFT_105938 [Guillardia theta CCMP2712]|uniref:Uncharacterized protein n=1 Tax=Guillardia theta (strain CCMP2712) TaxID=905079 RepID=L1JIM7_GUITC|nr:hypothetical protein GUITHDRAFT_105938 [Guillardia theta CCMP2712]EKX48331.1 hypothetical protein GUITHDRAFT_105938 [Guillardia theta CCMP2712]|eukprot:XP_005835311.1 hypothetical protein GUITHDRAFT_105938 [Guillardia theta CCMP2712]
MLLSKWTWQRLLVSLAFTSLFTNVLFLIMPSEDQRCVAIHSALEEKYKAALRRLDELNASLSEHAEVLRMEREEFEREKEAFQRMHQTQRQGAVEDAPVKLAVGQAVREEANRLPFKEVPDAVEARDGKWEGRTMKTSEILRILHLQGISTYGIVEKSELVDLLERRGMCGKQHGDEGLIGEEAGDWVIQEHKHKRFAEFARTSAKAATGVILCTAVWDATAFLGNPLAVPGLVDNALCGALAGLGLFGTRK